MPPHSDVAEQSLLGALLIDNQAFDRVADLVGAEDFYRDDHRRIWRHIQRLLENNRPADVVTVAESIEASEDKDKTGGPAYLAELAQNTPSSANVRRYAELVQERAMSRQIAAIGQALTDGALAPGADLVELRREAEHRLTCIAASAPDALLQKSFWVSDAQVTTELPYIVKGIFGRGQIIVFWGPPASGKTFVILELACAVGAGTNWRGRRTKQGVVIYVAAESSRTYIENRVAALKREHPALVDSKVLFVPVGLDLLHGAAGDVEKVISTAAILEKRVGQVSMVVVDTLAVTFGGGDENSPADMGAYVSNIQFIRAQTGAAVLVVHHTGKDEAKGMRGHSSLLGALDAELAIEGSPGQERILRTGKVRDGHGFSDVFAFSLRRVELGQDADGDPVSTCVVDSTDEQGTQRVRRDRKAIGLGKHQKIVLRIVEAAGRRIDRITLAKNLRDESVPRNRAHEAVASLLESGMLIAHDGPLPEVSLP